MSPNIAFCLLICGILGVYSELIWPGRVWPGIAGTGSVLTGGYFLWLASPAPLGLELLASAAVMLALDACVDTLYVAGTVATAALALGFTRLIIGPNRIQPVWAVPLCIALGSVTMALNAAGRRARRNKREQTSAQFAG
jgi:membrane-bound serine protease (ClpP class)